jgi:uncharacterized membrane protein
MIGGAFGEHPLFIGALLGGALTSVVAVRFAEYQAWMPRANRARVITGAVVGFCVAAIIATQTLSSPVGPVLSSLLIGVGAVIANRR